MKKVRRKTNKDIKSTKTKQNSVVPNSLICTERGTQRGIVDAKKFAVFAYRYPSHTSHTKLSFEIFLEPFDYFSFFLTFFDFFFFLNITFLSIHRRVQQMGNISWNGKHGQFQLIFHFLCPTACRQGRCHTIKYSNLNDWFV